MRQSGRILVLALAALFLGGCVGMQTQTRSSVVDYLYPDEKASAIEPSIPQLRLPLRVGIAFVPEQQQRVRGVNVWAISNTEGGLTEARKMALLKRVADDFKSYDFVKSIEVIPSAYLTPRGSFKNLDQIKTMYGIDVIALVSYDQVQFTDEGFTSLAYWTLVGAYVVSGEKNDTSTMLDTAVYDINSRKMLFRAPGLSRVQGRATAINLSEQLRKDSLKGFELATEDMITNLTQQLDAFKEKVKENPQEYRISHKPGYSGGGGGTFGPFELLLGALLGRAIIPQRRAS